MKTFKRKTFYTAVLAALGAIGAVGTASAVNVNPDGLGQVLIYPYYTVRTSTTSAATGAQNTYISVTNSTSAAKAVKVRFLEGKNSKEVLDFNLFLSAGDVWTGAVLPTAATDSVGVGSAKIITADKSCTFGTVTATPGQPFSNVGYVGDLGGDSMDRTNEGYVELIEMGVITHAGLLTAINHVGGVAPCTAATLAAADTAGLVGYLTTATGGLFGGASLINPSTGVDYSYDAVAIDGWDATVGGQGSASTSLTPSIVTGSITTSNVFVGGAVKTATWGGLTASRDAVSATIMRNHVMNEFVLDTSTQSGTDWVVTFPTKRFYVTGATALARQPFTNTFIAAGSCDVVSLSATALGGVGVFSREEQFSSAPGGFSPVTVTSNSLCWEANVITFNNATGSSTIFGSKNVSNIATTFPNGWAKLGFLQPTMVLTPLTSTTNGVADVTLQSYFGLPVVGFMAQSFVNSLISSFGGEFEHKYTRDIR
jgi:hypothetical protein